MSEGCTALAKLVGNRYMLAKNRDLIWTDFTDSIVFEKDVLLVRGVDVSDAKPCGASFGMNRWGLSACNTTVLVTDDPPYDTLLECVLRECKTIEEAYDLVRDDLSSGSRYQWCNFVLASPQGAGAIEIGDGVCVLERDSSMIIRTNHHLVLPTAEILKKASAAEREAGGPLATSQSRRQQAAQLLRDAASTMDIVKLMGTHASGRGFDSICRHRKTGKVSNPYLGETVYSYIAEVSGLGSRDMEFRISVTPGNPCSGVFKEFVVDFDASDEKKEQLVMRFP
ncbi:MAG: hypothetical protein C4K48_08975 [Candidatus Thorarchaeota archaeon]|nr:MAG: hypothetical protein C4K48_08975 [Candidatus Thorarchaeota archaeon]